MAAKLSQQALADRIGVSKVTVSDLERGKMKLDVNYMQRLARALGIVAADLLPHEAQDWALAPEERLLIERYRSGDHYQREQLQRVTEAIMPFRHAPNKVA